MLESEIGGAMTIDAVSFVAAPGTGQFSSFNDYQIFMGPTQLESLGTVFEENYSGAREMVYYDPQVTHYNNSDMVTIALEEPYYYPGQGNLIIEILYGDSGSIPDNQSIYIMYCASGSNLIAWEDSQGAAEGQLYPFLPHMFLSGEMSLPSSTFGTVKASFL